MALSEKTTQNVLAARNPRLLPSPSHVSDPDGLLSGLAKVAIDKILQKCPFEIGVALFKTLRLPEDTETSSNAIHDLARAIFDSWGIGRKGRDDGILYLMASQDRKHHLLAGRGIVGRLDESARSSVLEAAVGGLRSGDVDAATLKLVRRLVWELRWGWWLRRLCAWLFLTGATACFVNWFAPQFIQRLCHRLVGHRRQRMLREKREEKLRQAWERMAGFDSAGSHFCAPCVVCVEPLGTVAQDWMSELTLSRRGHLALRSDADSGLLMLDALPRSLQRKTVGFLGPSLQDFLNGECCQGACTDGVELFKCSHVLHKDCADQWLNRQNTCPVCRMPDPRITALATVPAAFAAAQLTRQHAGAPGWSGWGIDFADTVHDVAQLLEQPAYRHHTVTTSSMHASGMRSSSSARTSARSDGWFSGQISPLASDVVSTAVFGWGGGSSGGGAGTSGDW
eukprot:TRINITY_DN47627_c0_g1_i1.p1 TRINITY_DN47627_c0_g1~~TRINITY_DN47627_c0_g1_i1.p1  ORF type:complete len:453 (-),score=56.05 TRINITY_DN47627_c0_g1_i1:46-1404(-)